MPLKIYSTFRKVFTAGLKEYGFQRIGKTNWVGKLSGELFYYVMCGPSFSLYSLQNRKKGFSILVGIMSVYSVSMDESVFRPFSYPMYGLEKLNGIAYTPEDTFPYTEEDVLGPMTEALNTFIEYALPKMMAIQTLDDYLRYMKFMHSELMHGADNLTGREEALVMIKADNHDDYQDVFEDNKKWDLKRYGSEDSPGYIQDIASLRESLIEGIVEARDRVYADAELYRKAMDILQQREIENRQQLRQYGFDA